MLAGRVRRAALRIVPPNFANYDPARFPIDITMNRMPRRAPRAIVTLAVTALLLLASWSPD